MFVAQINPEDVTTKDEGLEVVLYSMGSGAVPAPSSVVPYIYTLMDRYSPVDLLRKCNAFRPKSAGFFDLRVKELVGGANLQLGLRRSLCVVYAVAAAVFYYVTHSLQISEFNELVWLVLVRAQMIHR